MSDHIRSTILVAEDDRLTARILNGLLTHEDHGVILAATGAETLTQAMRHKPDLILLDVGLPDMTGYDVCRQLRAHPELAEVPIIMVTALDDRPSRLHGLEVGADDFISKPFDEVELLARARTIVRLNRYRRVQEAHRLKEEIQMAAAIQQRLLPAAPPAVPGLELFACCQPAAFVGGDYYDFIQHDGRLYFFIGDVSGHGLASALFMSNARSAARALVPWIPGLVPLARALNARLTEDAGDSGMFLTTVIGCFDQRSGQLSIVNCGHPPPLLVRRGTAATQFEAVSQPLGMLDDLDAEEVPVDVTAGDLLLLYTDGVIESRAPDTSLFGIDRVSEVLTALTDRPVAGIAGGLLDAVLSFTARTRQEDDITLLLMRRE